MVKSQTPQIIFYEAFDEEEQLLKELTPSHINAVFTRKTIQEENPKTCPAPVISVRTQSKIPFEWKDDLDGILTRSTGYDHLVYYRKKTKTKAILGYLPLYCARAVAEQAMLVVLALLRKMKKQTNAFNTFQRDGLTGQECQDRKMLVVGVGNIGQEVADIARGLRMKVAGVDIDEKMSSLDYVDLKVGLAWADIVVCCLPFTELTNKMLNYSTMRIIKNGALFVNIARGEISPIGDIKRLLNEGILGGVGLDVFEKEKTLAEELRADKKEPDEVVKIVRELKDRDNVIFTPHNAFNTQESVRKKAEQSIEAVVEFLAEKIFPYPVPE